MGPDLQILGLSEAVSSYIAVCLLPTVFFLWVMSPWSDRVGTRAFKNLFFGTYPSKSSWGNNPLSQKVHEAGGLRFHWLCIIYPSMMIVSIGALMIGVPVPFVGILQGITMLLAWTVPMQWVDIAEHGAESIHGDRGNLHPDALAWLTQKGFDSYREGERWRMTRKGQEYDHLTPVEFDAEMRKREWASKIIIFLSRR